MQTETKTTCPNHPERTPYIKSRSALCETCLADAGQAIVDSGTYACLPWWARNKNYNWHQAMVRLGMAAQDEEKFADLVNSADAQYMA